jgi:cytochrome oxidase Cu insertion factor (SCO1/SenC/PrrC family)
MLLMLLLVGGAIMALGAIFALNSQGSPSSSTNQAANIKQTSSSNQAGQYAFQVGQPGPGMLAPAIRLTGTDGKIFDLAAMRGKTVLLYFQEGIDCQPCWDQMKDVQADGEHYLRSAERLTAESTR